MKKVLILSGIIYGMGTYEKGEIKGKAAMRDTYEMGKNV